MRLSRLQAEKATTTATSKGWRIRGASLLAALLLGNTLAHAGVPVNGRSQELDFTSEAVQTIAAADCAKRLDSNNWACWTAIRDCLRERAK